MLTLLRQIRKSLIQSGSARKYILYAIGEILLVMVGILLALQVNNWNEQRKDGRQYLKYINGLIEDVNADIDDLANNERANRVYAMAAKNLMHTYTSDQKFKDLELESPDGPVKEDTLRLLLSIQRSSFMAAPTVNRFTIEDIKSSGQTSIFKNDELKREIFDYYSRLGRYDEWWQGKLRAKYAMDDIKFELLDAALLNLSNLDEDDRQRVMSEQEIVPDAIIEVVRSHKNLLIPLKTMIYYTERISSENLWRTKFATEVLHHLNEEKRRLMN